MNDTQEQTMREPQAVKDWNLATGLPRAIVNWRVAKRECQQQSTNETLRRYLGAQDQLARALLGDLISEPGAHAIFDRFHLWLIETEEQSQ